MNKIEITLRLRAIELAQDISANGTRSVDILDRAKAYYDFINPPKGKKAKKPRRAKAAARPVRFNDL